MYNQDLCQDSGYYSSFLKDGLSISFYNTTPSLVKISLKGDGVFLGVVDVSEIPQYCGSLFLSNLVVYREGESGHGSTLLLCAKRFAELGCYSGIHCIIPDFMNKNFFIKRGFKKLNDKHFNFRSSNTCRSYFFLLDWKKVLDNDAIEWWDELEFNEDDSYFFNEERVK